jgi:hypothetical protein
MLTLDLNLALLVLDVLSFMLVLCSIRNLLKVSVDFLLLEK